MILLITYDLNNPIKDYTTFYNEIKKAGNWWHHIRSTWIIQTQYNPKNWYERLGPLIGKNDFIYITEIRRNHYGWLPQKAWEWLEGRFDEEEYGC